MRKEMAIGNTFIPGEGYETLLNGRDDSLAKKHGFLITSGNTCIGGLLGLSDFKVRYGVFGFVDAFNIFHETGELPVYKRKALEAASWVYGFFINE